MKTFIICDLKKRSITYKDGMEKQKCPKCKTVRYTSDFGIRRLDIPYKTCLSCRENDKKHREKRRCEHGRQRNNCKDCGGASICEHNRRRSNCKDCGGSSICEHDRQRNQCKECGGSSICEHNKMKSKCKDCGGSSICEHNRQRYQCKDCRGTSVCEHGRQRHQCKDCGGSIICEHNRRRHQCKDCQGTSICDHNKRKHNCIVCTPKRACQNCLSVYVKSTYRFHPYCFRCYCVLNPDANIPRQYKLKEHYLRDRLKESFPGLSMVFDKTVDSGCSHRRPDVRIECLTHTVIIECDENQHSDYTCENKRVMELFRDLGSRPIVVIRFNPDWYMEEGRRVEGCFNTSLTGVFTPNDREWDWRIKELKRAVNKYLKDVPSKEVTIEHLFYDI